MSQPAPQDTYLRYCTAFEGWHGPFAWLDLDAFDANLAAVAKRSAGKPLRLASKSIRSLPLLKRALAHPQAQGVMCFSAREAAYLARHGLDDLLVAYPTLSRPDVGAVAALVAAGQHITLMVDDEGQLDMLEEAARGHAARLPVCLELDVSQDYPGLRFGTHRSPLRDAGALLRLAGRIGRSPWLRLDGLMAYEGQIAGLGNLGSGPKAQVIRQLQRRALRDVAERRAQAVQALERAGHTLRFVNGGGTGSLESSAAEEVVTEVAMGSGLYSPALFDGYGHFRHQPALGFALSVVRRPRHDTVTCLGGGYIASGAAGPDRLPTPYLPAGLSLLPSEGAGEVQTPLRETQTHLRLGDLVFFRHSKAGELCEHFNELQAVSGSAQVGSFQTYRGAGLALP